MSSLDLAETMRIRWRNYLVLLVTACLLLVPAVAAKYASDQFLPKLGLYRYLFILPAAAAGLGAFKSWRCAECGKYPGPGMPKQCQSCGASYELKSAEGGTGAASPAQGTAPADPAAKSKSGKGKLLSASIAGALWTAGGIIYVCASRKVKFNAVSMSVIVAGAVIIAALSAWAFGFAKGRKPN